MKTLAAALASLLVAGGVIAVLIVVFARGENGGPPSETGQIEDLLYSYAERIDAEDWEGACALLAPEVLVDAPCEQVVQELARQAAGRDVRARIKPLEIDFFQLGGFATYEICVAYGDGPETCVEETVHVSKATGVWLIGRKQEPLTPSPTPG